MLDINVDVKGKFAQLHSLDNVQINCTRQLLKQILLFLDEVVAFVGRLGKMRISYFYLFKICNVIPSTYLDLAQTFEEILETARQVVNFLQRVLFGCVIFQQLLLIIAGPRELLGDQMIEKDPESEGVCFEGINAFLQGFGRHVKRTTYHIHLFDLRGLVGQVPSEPEIADFPLVILEENIGRFNIPVYYQFFLQILTGLEQLMKDHLPIQISIGLYVRLEGPSFAVVGDDVAIILSVEDIVHFNYIGVIQLLEDVDLVLQELVIALAHFGQFYYFHRVGDAFVVVLAALEHLAAVPAPDAIAQIVRIAPDPLFPVEILCVFSCRQTSYFGRLRSQQHLIFVGVNHFENLFNIYLQIISITTISHFFLFSCQYPPPTYLFASVFLPRRLFPKMSQKNRHRGWAMSQLSNLGQFLGRYPINFFLLSPQIANLEDNSVLNNLIRKKQTLINFNDNSNKIESTVKLYIFRRD